MRASAALLVVSLLAAGWALLPDELRTATREVDADGFAPVLFASVDFFETDLDVVDGLRLHADVYLPADPIAPDAPTRFPTILVLSPYFGDGSNGEPNGSPTHAFLTRRLAPRGYAIVLGDLVGSGGSSGCWDFMGPQERAGAVAMVEAIARQPWSDGKVGMMGLSYDAMTQVMAASDAAPHLVTIVPAAPLTHAYGGLLQNGVHYGGTWHLTPAGYEASSLAPPGTNQARAPGWIERMLATPPCAAENAAGTASDAYAEYYQARDLRPLGANVRASVFYMQGFADALVKPNHFGAWFDAVTTPKKAWLGHWGHMHPDAEASGRPDLYLTLHRWFDHELKGIANGIDREPSIDVQDQDGAWRHEARWPPEDARPLVLHLGADGTLARKAAAAGAVAFGGPASLVEQAAGVATFESAALPGELRISGAPILDLTLASDRPTGQVIARLYEGERLVSQGAYDLLYADGLDAPTPLVPGEPVRVRLQLYPTEHAVARAAALRLELSVQDPLGWYDDDASGATLTLAAGEDATLVLPTVERDERDVFLVSCGQPLRPPEPDCYLGLDDLGLG